MEAELSTPRSKLETTGFNIFLLRTAGTRRFPDKLSHMPAKAGGLPYLGSVPPNLPSSSKGFGRTSPSQRVGTCSFLNKMMDEMTFQGHFQPPRPILFRPTTIASKCSELGPGLLLTSNKKWGGLGARITQDHCWKDLFPILTSVGFSSPFFFASPFCVCCIETESAFVPITRH